MRRDDVKHALDALASQVPAPKSGAGAAIARGRRRRAQRRVALVGIAAALIAAVAIVGTIAQTHNSARVVTPRPATTTLVTRPSVASGPALQIAVVSGLEAWKCLDPLQHTDDGGGSWQAIAVPTGVAPETDLGCTAIKGGDAWAVRSNADRTRFDILRVRDGADVHDFAFPQIAKGALPTTPVFVDRDHGWIRVVRGTTTALYRTVDGGATWTLATNHSPIGDLVFENADRGWNLYNGALFVTNDAGTTWYREPLPDPTAPSGSYVARIRLTVRRDTLIVWSGFHISGSRFRTFFDVSTDDGNEWSVRNGPAGFELPQPGENNAFNATNVTQWQLTSGHALRLTDDAGLTWQSRPDVPSERDVSSIAFPTADVGWITDLAGSILRTTDEGASWTDVTRGAATEPNPTETTPTVPPSAPPPPPVPIPLAFVSPSQGWICDNPLWYSATGAATSPAFTNNWHTIDIASHPPTLPKFQYPLCSAIPGGEAWVLTTAADPSRAQVIRIETGRAKKETLALPQLGSNATYAALTFVDATHGWALSAQTNSALREHLYATTDGGETWTLRNGHAPIDVQAGQDRPLTFVSDTEGWGLGSGNNVELTTDGGRTWRAVPLPVPFVGNGAAKYVSTVVPSASGTIVAAGGQQTGTDTVPFFDVSTDGGRTWTSRSGPPGMIFAATVPSAFGAIDADHWEYAYSNSLFLTSDGGRTWTQVAQFAGMAHATSVEFVTPQAGFVAGVADPPDDTATYVLQTLDGGATWSTVDEHAPSRSGSSNVVGFPGGLIGCPTRPLTPVPPGNPPAGLVDAAQNYLGGSGAATIIAVHPVSQPTQDFGRLFGFQVGSCGTQAVADSWVVQLSSPSTDPAVAEIESQLALAHSADGWHVFGRYP